MCLIETDLCFFVQVDQLPGFIGISLAISLLAPLLGVEDRTNNNETGGPEGGLPGRACSYYYYACFLRSGHEWCFGQQQLHLQRLPHLCYSDPMHNQSSTVE